MDLSQIRSSLEPHLKQETVEEFVSIYQQLLDRRQEVCPILKGEDAGNIRWTSQHSLALRQVFLHRTISTITGAIVCLREKLWYSVALSVRGNFETTAALGYLYERLHSLANGTLPLEQIEDDICVMLLGTRYDRPNSQGLTAKSVLTLLEYATKAVKRVTFANEVMPPDMLTDPYNFLCEFCHPNFSSNSLAFHFDKEKSQLRMRHDGEMLKGTAHIEYLLLSAPFFIDLYDGIPGVLATIKSRLLE